MATRMTVIKKDGTTEHLQVSQIEAKLDRLIATPTVLVKVPRDRILCDTLHCLVDGVKTSQIDDAMLNTTVGLIRYHPDNSKLAARLTLDEVRRKVRKIAPTFTAAMELCNKMTLAQAPSHKYELWSEEFIKFVRTNSVDLDSLIDDTRDDYMDYFGATVTVEKYLHRNSKGELLETVQYFKLRVAVAVSENMEQVRTVYDILSKNMAGFATPIMLNCGMIKGSSASCFLLAITHDNLESIIGDGLLKSGVLSRGGGGVAVYAGRMRAGGATISGTNGTTNGPLRFLHEMDAQVDYVDQGGGPRGRKGSIAVYFPVWHPDALDAISLKLPSTKECEATFNLFYGLTIPDIFMKRYTENVNSTWTMFCPCAVRKVLNDVKRYPGANARVISYIEEMRNKLFPEDSPELDMFFGTEFEEIYEFLEFLPTSVTGAKATTTGVIVERIFSLWSQLSIPYIVFTDALNAGWEYREGWGPALVMSNLCTEIVHPVGNIPKEACFKLRDEIVKKVVAKDERVISTMCRTATGGVNQHLHLKLNYFMRDNVDCVTHEISNDPTVVSVCNLCSITIPAYISVTPDGTAIFDLKRMQDVVKVMVRSFATILNRTFNPLKNSMYGNLLMRNIGVGVVGMADAVLLMGLEQESVEALHFQETVHAHIYYAAVDMSADMSNGKDNYPLYENSHMYNGRFRFEFGRQVDDNFPAAKISFNPHGEHVNLDWESLRRKVAKKGQYFGHLTSNMPTATSSQMQGWSETMEQRAGFMMSRKVNIGYFTCADPCMVKHFEKTGRWNDKLADAILNNKGSVRNLPSSFGITEKDMRLLVTSSEMKVQSLLRLHRMRAAYTTQTSSNSIDDPVGTAKSMNTALILTWKYGLTGTYYYRVLAKNSGKSLQIEQLVEESKGCNGDACSS